jgi:hypothetical protein
VEKLFKQGFTYNNMKKIIKKGGKTAKITICIIAALILIFAGLFAAFLISEHKTAPVNQTEANTTNQNNTPAANNTPPAQQNTSNPCSFTLGTVNDLIAPFRWHTLTFRGTTEGNSTTVTYSTIFYVNERNGLVEGNFIATQRNNPFRIENISSNITEMPGKKAFISYDSSASKCPNLIIAGMELGTFMGILGTDSKGAVTSIKDASSPDQVKTCTNADENTTIYILKSGGCDPGITQEGNCVTIDAGKKCYIVETAERAIMNMIELGMKQGTLKTSK